MDLGRDPDIGQSKVHWGNERKDDLMRSKLIVVGMVEVKLENCVLWEDSVKDFLKISSLAMKTSELTEEKVFHGPSYDESDFWETSLLHQRKKMNLV